MKKELVLICTTLISIALYSQEPLKKDFKISESDCESCNAALNPELKEKKLIIEEKILRSWLSEYFNSSEERRREIKNEGSTSVSIAAIIQSIPIQFGANNSSSNMDRYWYTKYVTWQKESYIAIDDIYYAYQEVLTPSAWDKWLECKKISCGQLYLNGIELKISPIREGIFLIELWNYSDNKIKINSVDFDNLEPSDKKAFKGKKIISAFRGSTSTIAKSKYSNQEPFTISVNYTIFNSDRTSPTISKTWKPLEKKYDLPLGTILAWSYPIVVGASSADIKQNIPAGWVICDGTDPRSPNLSNKFLMGTKDFDQVGKPGGTDKHSHSGTTENAKGGAHSTDGRSNACMASNHTHQFTTNEVLHIPPFFAVIYIMKIE
jgi:hypothetical protein